MQHYTTTTLHYSTLHSTTHSHYTLHQFHDIIQMNLLNSSLISGEKNSFDAIYLDRAKKNVFFRDNFTMNKKAIFLNK